MCFYVVTHLMPYHRNNDLVFPSFDLHTSMRRDASAPLAKSDFLMWVEKGLKIDLAADLSIEDVGKALGVYAEHEKEQQPALACTAVEG